MLKKARLLTRPTPAAISPAHPESAKTASLPKTRRSAGKAARGVLRLQRFTPLQNEADGLFQHPARSLSKSCHSSAAHDPQASASCSAQKNPQRIPANTLPVFSSLRPRICRRLLRLATKDYSDRLLRKRPPCLPDLAVRWPEDAGQENTLSTMNTLDATLVSDR